MKTFIAFFIALIIVGFISFTIYQNKSAAPKKQSLVSFTVALDWTPNTNHTGIYVAIKKGWYKDQGIDLKILPYSSDASPDILVASNKADAGIGSTESVVADKAIDTPVVSVAAILQHNTSGFIALKESGITRPKDFDNKIYGGYGAPYENAVVSEIIKKDGGNGKFKNVTLDTAATDALISKKIDFYWVFAGWEGIQIARENVTTVFFSITQFGIADYYTPVIIASPKEIAQKNSLLKRFMKATQMGYEFARKNPKEAAQILIDTTPKGTFPDTGLVFASQNYLSPRYADPNRAWGIQDKNAWHGYPQFMLDSGSILDKDGKPVKTMNFDDLYTNEFLQ